MISKTRRNRISKTRRTDRNMISKSKRISGGKNGDVHTWNLGLFTLKRKEGVFNDDYWIEYPTDPLPEGWTQIPPKGWTQIPPKGDDNILPTYSNVGNNEATQLIRPIDVADYKVVVESFAAPILYGDYIKDVVESFAAPIVYGHDLVDLVNGKDKKKWDNFMQIKDTRKKYISILQKHAWNELKEVPTSKKSGLNSFLKDNIFVLLDQGKSKSGITRTQWSVRPQSTVVYMSILDGDNKKMPVGFQKLYETVRDWNLEMDT